MPFLSYKFHAIFCFRVCSSFEQNSPHVIPNFTLMYRLGFCSMGGVPVEPGSIVGSVFLVVGCGGLVSGTHNGRNF